MSTGTKMPRIEWVYSKDIELNIPTIGVQRHIADYLDAETAQIDASIDAQRRLIALLQERRVAAIVASIQVNSPNRLGSVSSEVPWLSYGRTGWPVTRLKNFGRVTLGKMLQSTNSGSDVHAFYMRAANVQPDGKLSLSNSKMMWFGSSELSQLDLRAGDVVVVEGGVGGYARAAYLKTDVPNWGFQNSINRVRPLHGNDGRFLAYCLIAARRMDFFSAYCNIVSMPHLTAEKLAAMYIPLPPPAEQRRIADYLDAATSKIDTLITRSERLIELLKERRSAVITTAVTGQIDVTSSKEAA